MLVGRPQTPGQEEKYKNSTSVNWRFWRQSSTVVYELVLWSLRLEFRSYGYFTSAAAYPSSKIIFFYFQLSSSLK